MRLQALRRAVLYSSALLITSLSAAPTAPWAGTAGDKQAAALARAVIEQTGKKEGPALVVGAGDGRFLINLAKQSALQITCVEPDPERVRSARDALDQLGLYGTRVVVHQGTGTVKQLNYPECSADLVVVPEGPVEWTAAEGLYRVLRPLGHVLYMCSERLEGEADKAQRHATSMFSQKIKAIATSPEHLPDEATQLDYQDEFYELQQRLRQHDIVLAEKVFGLGEETASPHSYQRMLQLWTAEELVGLALDSELTVTKHPKVRVATKAGKTLRASNLTVLPVRPYFLDPGDKKPYLLEFPVRMELRGNIEGVLAFLRSLHNKDKATSLPITHLELRKVLPPGSPESDHVEMTVECCSFFPFPAEPPKRRYQRKGPR